MKSVFLLQHSYEDDGIERSKIIGIYSSKENAERTIEKYKTISGFKDYPNDFYIDEYEIDKCEWQEGFIKSGEALDELTELIDSEKTSD
jgi:homoserine kinase type II